MDVGGVIWGIAKKALSILLTLLMILTVDFGILYIVPGDPSSMLIPRGASPELMEELTNRYHLNDPLSVQFFYYMTDFLTGDFRISLSTLRGVEISDFIWEYAGWTIALLAGVVVFSIAAGTLLALVAARKRGGISSHVIHTFSLLLLSVPAFALGIFLLMLAVDLSPGIPVRGNLSDDAMYMEDFDLIVDALRHAFLPVLTGTLSSLGLFVLLARAGVSESVERADWSGKGNPGKLPPFAIANGLFLIRPFAQFYLAWAMATVLAVEVAFSYRGLGFLAWESLMNLDFGLLMACVFVISLIVLLGNILLSAVLAIAREARLGDALSGWVHEDRTGPENVVPSPRSNAYSKPFVLGLRELARAFLKSTSGVIALIIFVVLLAIGLLAPVIGVVSDPQNLSSREPNMPMDGWSNPLPPSFEKSRYTGWMHPLGTDRFGQDVYSLWLHAARSATLSAIAVSAMAVLIGVLVGFASATTTRIDRTIAGFFDFVLTIPARTMLAIPFLALFVALLAVEGWGTFVVLPYMVLAIYAWAWTIIARHVRAKVRVAGVDEPGNVGAHRNPTGAVLPSILSSTMLVAKFAAVAVLLTQAGLDFLGLGRPGDITWGNMLEQSYIYGAIALGQWHLIVPPLLGIFLVAASVFVVLDRVEMIARSAERKLMVDAGTAPVPPVIAPAGQ